MALCLRHLLLPVFYSVSSPRRLTPVISGGFGISISSKIVGATSEMTPPTLLYWLITSSLVLVSFLLHFLPIRKNGTGWTVFLFFFSPVIRYLFSSAFPWSPVIITMPSFFKTDSTILPA